MPPSVVGLLTAVGTATSAVASVTHGDLFWAVVVDAAAATGLAAYLALLPNKKNPSAVALASLDVMQLIPAGRLVARMTLRCLLQPCARGSSTVPAASG